MATSEAVVHRGEPVFGIEMRAITAEPLSITRRNTLLKPPSARLTISTHFSAQTLLAAIT
ncbi:hypothetical protein RRF57_008984 [Xylaria bambusicola]|uniref:Uncharacterized protein n=1 Tax=Xylaria bambusicola TaxID=326684 RepID=A0AAN7UUU3_9PEZI